MRNLILISNEQDNIDISKDIIKLIKTAVNTTLEFEDYKKRAEVSVTICDDETIKSLNSRHRNIDKVTDVLSFPLLGSSDEFDYDLSKKAVALGDIVICAPRAAQQAVEYGHAFEREIVFLVVHSMLHLLGYDHTDERDGEEEMFCRQREILHVIGIER